MFDEKLPMKWNYGSKDVLIWERKDNLSFHSLLVKIESHPIDL